MNGSRRAPKRLLVLRIPWQPLGPCPNPGSSRSRSCRLRRACTSAGRRPALCRAASANRSAAGVADTPAEVCCFRCGVQGGAKVERGSLVVSGRPEGSRRATAPMDRLPALPAFALSRIIVIHAWKGTDHGTSHGQGRRAIWTSGLGQGQPRRSESGASVRRAGLYDGAFDLQLLADLLAPHGVGHPASTRETLTFPWTSSLESFQVETPSCRRWDSASQHRTRGPFTIGRARGVR